MPATRIAKIALLALIAFYFLIVVLNNTILDYRSNYGFVQHVLTMDTLFSGEAQRWRAFPDPTPEDNSYWLHHAFYWSVIAWEALTGMLCGFGSIRLARQLKAPARAFNASKSLAIYGLTLSLLQWFAAFLTVGGEWFLMWQSDSWNGQDAAARMFLVVGVVLIFVAMKDEDQDPAE